jgi:mannose-1-phosphate guanylyltransferase/mannose-6-phosphate isomerase
MIVVIIAGGAGTRLWPLSTPEYPKQLLKINSPDRSLLQQTYGRAEVLSKKIYVVSEVSHIAHVREQLSNLSDEHFIVEPARRGTSNCLALALTYISKREDNDEPIAFISADHFIKDTTGFKRSFKVAGDVSKKTKRIVLVGIEPDYPATGFGYIEKGESLKYKDIVFNVKSFKEKPSLEVAKSYLKAGRYLWNCSYFVGSVNVFKSRMSEYAPNLYSNFDLLKKAKSKQLNDVYLSLEKDTIDYALIEKVPDLLVVPASFDWIDVGSFSDWFKIVGHDKNGNHIIGESVEVINLKDSFIQNHGKKPLAVIGLENVVIINTDNGVLITHKDLTQHVGDISKRFNKEA